MPCSPRPRPGRAPAVRIFSFSARPLDLFSAAVTASSAPRRRRPALPRPHPARPGRRRAPAAPAPAAPAPASSSGIRKQVKPWEKTMACLRLLSSVMASMLWRKRVIALASEFPDIELSHMYVDNAAMQLIRNPKQGPGLFEPIHVSAPDIAGQDKANPLATILSAAMLLHYGLGEENAAKRIEAAVIETLNHGFRTGGIYSPGTTLVGCKWMSEEVLKTVESRKAVAVVN